MIDFPNIDPIIFSIGPFKARWYGLSYAIGIILGWQYAKYISNKKYIDIFFDSLITHIILGILIGGRLGFIIFYGGYYFINNPIEIIKIWEGGMSFHGGLIGVIIGSYLACKKNKVNYLPVMDILSMSAPIGLFFGRIANFINGELYGRITDVKWGVIFPNGGHVIRHPSQIYESLLEGIFIFISQYLFYKYTHIKKYPGLLSASFLCQYSIIRIIVENYREPDEHIGFIFGYVTMGQILSFIMLAVSFILFIYIKISSTQYITNSKYHL